MIRIRTARPSDLDAIATLVTLESERGILLPRTREDIARNLGSFVVAIERNGGDAELVGCGALRCHTASLGEVRSLAVTPRYRGNGVGARIVRTLVRRAGRQGVVRLFAATQSPAFFGSLRFAPVPIDSVPEKTSADCASCPWRNECREVLVERTVGRP